MWVCKLVLNNEVGAIVRMILIFLTYFNELPRPLRRGNSSYCFAQTMTVLSCGTCSTLMGIF